MAKAKSEIITCKVDASVMEAMKGIPNRSEFIRGAILTALDMGCPVCGGTGILTPGQKQHWNAFAEEHQIVECENCHELHLTCMRPAGAAETAECAKGGKK